MPLLAETVKLNAKCIIYVNMKLNQFSYTCSLLAVLAITGVLCCFSLTSPRYFGAWAL